MGTMLLVTAMVVFFAVLAIVGTRQEKKRLGDLAAAIERLGGTIDLKPAADAQQAAYAATPVLATTGRGADKVRLIAQVTIEGTPVLLVHYRYVTGSGKNRTTHDRTVARVVAPASWPQLTLTRENVLHKLADMVGFKDIRLDDEAFNKAWRVKSKDENFAMLAISPEVQAWLMAQKKSWIFEIGRGAICVVSHTIARGPDLEPQARAAAELARLIPPELQAYQAAAAS